MTKTWIKSSHSGTDGGNCVEVAASAHAIHIRDSKAAPGPQIDLRPVAWATFLDRTAPAS